MSATVSWEARARRRELLDDALADMTAAADELGMRILIDSAADAAMLVRPLLTAQLRASALAGRPVGPVPAKYAAPLRWRMSRHLDAVLKEFPTAIGEIDDESTGPRAAVAALCARSSMVALLWWRRPFLFRRRDPLQAADGFADELATGLDDIIRTLEP